ncbi:MAG: hypothetical protein LC775_05125 [Acidobacteria bacterium]|nr:hypothetical protein [Acidobacteriota bacterium]
MVVTKKLVCLANSRKHNGRCIAGIEIESKKWIRPVSNRSGHEVSVLERQYRNGVEPQVLDLISVSLVEARPIEFQRENWLLDPAVRWLKVGRIGWGGLCTLEQSTLEQRPRGLWINGYNTSAGVNDCVPAEQKEMLVDSLKLIRVGGVTIEVSPAHPMSTDPKPIVRARFRHVSSEYAFESDRSGVRGEISCQGVRKLSVG